MKTQQKPDTLTKVSNCGPLLCSFMIHITDSADTCPWIFLAHKEHYSYRSNQHEAFVPDWQ